jgi:CRP-like cAMP-binding protein
MDAALESAIPPPGRRVAEARSASFPDAESGRASATPAWSRRASARHTIFAAGDAAQFIYETAGAAAMVSRRLPDGQRQIIDIVGPGRLFGFAPDRRHDCTAQALAPCVIYAYDRATIRLDPAAAARAAAAALDEIRRLRDLVAMLGRKTAMERVASFFAALLPERSALSATIVVPISRGEMANYLGLTIETASRNVVRLKRALILGEETHEEMTVLDAARLRAFALGES